MRNFQVLFLYEHKHLERSSNLYECTFKAIIVYQKTMAFVYEKAYGWMIFHISRDLFTTHNNAATLEKTFGISFRIIVNWD